MRIPLSCGCKVVCYKEDDSWSVEWCNLHASAPDLLEALELVLATYNNRDIVDFYELGCAIRDITPTLEQAIEKAQC